MPDYLDKILMVLVCHLIINDIFMNAFHFFNLIKEGNTSIALDISKIEDMCNFWVIKNIASVQFIKDITISAL